MHKEAHDDIYNNKKKIENNLNAKFYENFYVNYDL